MFFVFFQRKKAFVKCKQKPKNREKQIEIMSLPPILSTLNDKLEKYLTDPSGLPIHDTEPATRFWERIPNPKRELQVTHGPLSTTLL